MKEIIITATVLILCILLIRRAFRGKISSRLQYALWLLVVFRLIIPVSAQIDMGPLSHYRLMDLVRQAELEQGDMASRLEEPIRVAVDSRSMLYRLVGNDVQRAQMEESLNNMSDDGASVVFMAGTLAFSWLDVLTLVWTAGMFTVGLWIIGSNAVFGHKLKKSRRLFVLSEEEKNTLFKKDDGSDIFRKKNRLPVVYLSDHISSPCLYGFFGREAVYLTEDVTKDSEKLKHVLVHELVHKKHGDSFWALLRGILVTVYWFHPLVWVAAACSKRDCELACDESALALLGEKERISYGETLLSIITKKRRISDLVCTATTMTGSGKSVKERIQFIVKKPRVLYTAMTSAALLTVVACLFVFTQNPQFDGGMMVDGSDGLTVMGADMQIQLPASIGGIGGCIVEEESDDVVIYHIKTKREVGRFSKMTFGDAIALVDEGRDILPIGNQGSNYLLRAYMGEPLTWTEHNYTLPEDKIEHAEKVPSGTDTKRTEHIYTPAGGETQGVLRHEDIYTPAGEELQGTLRHEEIYIPAEEGSQGALGHEDTATGEALPEESITTQPFDSSDTGVSETEHTYIPAEKTETGVPGTDSAVVTEIPKTDDDTVTAVPGTDSDDDTTYMIDSGKSVPAGKGKDYNPMLDKDWEVIPLEEEAAEEEVKVDYLPNEMISTTTYRPREVTADEIDTGCCLYIKADYDHVNGKYLEEMEFIDEELRTAAENVIILSLNRERREALFDALTKNRTPYVGDNSKVGALLSALPLPPTLNRTEGFSLQTVELPYSLRFGYEMSTDFFTKEDQDMLYFNAAMLFYSIGNVEEIAIEVNHPSRGSFMMMDYYREDFEKDIPALQGADYENDQVFREKLPEVHAAVEEQIFSGSHEK